MKHIIFTLLLAASLVAISGVAFEVEPRLAQADALSRLRQSYEMSIFKSSYKFDRLELLKRVADKISNDYVEPGRVDPAEMLDGALTNAGRAVPEAMFEYEPGDELIHGTVGSHRREILVGRLNGIRDLTRVLEDVAEFLGEYAPPETELEKVEYALINGMLGTLDPHSVFINPEAFEEMTINNEGAFGGLGITIGIRDKRLTILYPLPDTPAFAAGLMSRDKIVRIGSESTVNMGLEEAVGKLRGDPGSEITITIEREQDDELRTFEVTLIREVISVPSVKGRYLGDGVGGVQIVHFSQDTTRELERLITEMDRAAVEEGREGLEGLVLDLRDNPGGYLNQAIQVCDKFLSSGIIVSTRGNARQPGEYHEATRFGTEESMRLVVLVDYGSASASEIFAGALRNLDRGVVVGVTTFGKGSVQNLYPFHHDESALKLTIDHYLTPGDHSIQSVGIAPDIELRPVWIEEDGDVYFHWQDAMMREKDLDDHFDGGVETDPALHAYAYLDPDNELWSSDYDRDAAPDLQRWADDFQVQFAKTIVQHTTSTDRSRMLTESLPAIQALMAEQNTALAARFGELGVDWSPADAESAAGGVPRADISMSVGSADGVLAVGEPTTLTLSVSNVGDAPFYRLRAMAESDLIDGREFVFGRIDPGETREWTVELTPGLEMSSRTDEVTFAFDAEGSRAPGEFVGRLMVDEKPRPRFAYNYQVIDDGSGASAGNGDGLIQPGEAIDLLVTVQNIGEGPTGDLYLRRQRQQGDDDGATGGDGGLSPLTDDHLGDHYLEGDEADAAIDAAVDAATTSDDDEIRPSGVVRLKNKSGSDVFLTEGTAEFTLQPGELMRSRLHFDVAQELSGDVIELEMAVGDSEFWEFFVDDLELPVVYSVDGAMPPTEVPGHAKSYRTRGMVAVRGGTGDDAPRVASADGVVKATGKLGDRVRVQLPWGVSGWIDGDDLKAGGGSAGDEVFLPWISRSPPVVLLSSRVGGTAVDSDTIQLSGTVRDDQAVKDLFIFVNGEKVFYRAMEDGGARASTEFELSIGLDAGDNKIEIIARDNEDLMGSTSIGVYRTGGRETARAGH